MKLGYVIAYVADVDATIEWWERAFGLSRRFVAEDGSYGELDTGATTLSFASHEMGKANLPGGFVAHDPSGPPAALEIALVDDDVPAAHARAVEAGARELAGPQAEAVGPDRLVRARPQRRPGRALHARRMRTPMARPPTLRRLSLCSPRRSRSTATAARAARRPAVDRSASAGSSRRAGGPTRRCAGPTPSSCWPTAASPSSSRISSAAAGTATRRRPSARRGGRPGRRRSAEPGRTTGAAGRAPEAQQPPARTRPQASGVALAGVDRRPLREEPIPSPRAATRSRRTSERARPSKARSSPPVTRRPSHPQRAVRRHRRDAQRLLAAAGDAGRRRG